MSVSVLGAFAIEPVLGDKDLLRWNVNGIAQGDVSGGTVSIISTYAAGLDFFGGKWLWDLRYVFPMATTNPGSPNFFFAWYTAEGLRSANDAAYLKTFRITAATAPQLNESFVQTNYTIVLPKMLFRPRTRLNNLGCDFIWDSNVNGCTYQAAAGGFIYNEQALTMQKVIAI